MIYPDNDFNRPFSVRASNGSSSNLTYSLDMENALLAIESVAMPTGGFVKDLLSKFIEMDSESTTQPQVLRSLEKSLKEHADTWAELSKY